MSLPQRKLTRVAVGVLLRADGRVLLADRPTGKPYAGYWEFPGGKIEAGEPVARALERELHEELGLDIGPSYPWVTFEFDYPHAFVELQFRLVCQWHGEPQAREGQRLRFVDPMGELPQPLLPAAVPALRWLLLPPVAVLITPADLAPLASGGARREVQTDAARLVVIDADWRGGDGRLRFAAQRSAAARGRPWLLASGSDAGQAAGVDGVVVEASALAGAGEGATGWFGVWVDSDEDLRCASGRGCDFVLVRSSALAERLGRSPPTMPAYFSGPSKLQEPGGYCAPRRWIDLRSPDPALRLP